jgi:hypothetical protein
MLRKNLDEVPLWRKENVAVRQLIEDFAKYLYLPRLITPQTLLNSMTEGIKSLAWESETFAYAELYDEVRSEYKGVKVGELVPLSMDDRGWILKPDVAKTALEKMAPKPSSHSASTGAIPPSVTTNPGSTSVTPMQQSHPKRFYGTIELDPLRMTRDAGKVAEEVVAHLSGIVGANVKITLEISADIPDGVPDQTVRIVSENCRSLKFKNQDFESD